MAQLGTETLPGEVAARQQTVFLLMMCYYISQDFIASDQSSSNGPK